MIFMSLVKKKINTWWKDDNYSSIVQTDQIKVKPIGAAITVESVQL